VNTVCGSYYILTLIGGFQKHISLAGDIVQSPTSGLYYKCFMIIIYDCNDSGQYYKTTITIVIDDPS